jgi:hypothetical protein
MEELSKYGSRNIQKRHQEQFLRWFEGRVNTVFLNFFPCDRDMSSLHKFMNKGFCFEIEFADQASIRERGSE